MRLSRLLPAGYLASPASRIPAPLDEPAAAKRFGARLLLAVVFAFVCPLVSVAHAAKPGTGGKTVRVAPLALISEYSYNNVNSPPWCLNEDDMHLRSWSGSVAGTLAVTEQLCDPALDYFNEVWWDAGGIGLQAEAYVVGALSDLTITSPLGDSRHGVLVGSSTANGVTTDRYQVCYVPSFSITTDTGGKALPGGTWGLTLSGTITKATYNVKAEMAYVAFQQQHCPASEQNLVP
jgi:hypothetical protein